MSCFGPTFLGDIQVSIAVQAPWQNQEPKDVTGLCMQDYPRYKSKRADIRGLFAHTHTRAYNKQNCADDVSQPANPSIIQTSLFSFFYSFLFSFFKMCLVNTDVVQTGYRLSRKRRHGEYNEYNHLRFSIAALIVYNIKLYCRREVYQMFYSFLNIYLFII